jgi:hypothetical protein
MGDVKRFLRESLVHVTFAKIGSLLPLLPPANTVSSLRPCNSSLCAKLLQYLYHSRGLAFKIQFTACMYRGERAEIYLFSIRGINCWEVQARLLFGSHETSPIIWTGKPATAIQCQLRVFERWQEPNTAVTKYIGPIACYCSMKGMFLLQIFNDI